MMYDAYRGEIDELVQRAIFFAHADARYPALNIKPAVMRKRVEQAVFEGEYDVSRLVGIALGDHVVVQFPFCGTLEQRRVHLPHTAAGTILHLARDGTRSKRRD